MKTEVWLNKQGNVFIITLRLWSKMKPGRISYKEFNPAQYGSEENIKKAVNVLTCLMCEHQNEQYGDVHDTTDAVKSMFESFKETMMDFHQKQKLKGKYIDGSLITD